MAREVSAGSGGGGSWGDGKIKIPPAVGYVPGLSDIVDAGRESFENIADNVGGPFDIVVWVRENWQLAVLGLVAFLVLLRD